MPDDHSALALSHLFSLSPPSSMLLTTVNVTGDATVASVVAKSLGKFGKPKVKDWDDHIDEVTS